MKQNDQQRHLANDLDILIDRYANEYDLSYASVIGVLQIKIIMLCHEVLDTKSE